MRARSAPEAPSGSAAAVSGSATASATLAAADVRAKGRMLRAISNPYVDIIGHPTGRLLLERAGYVLDMEAVIDAAVEHGVCIEINAHPSRLDMDWRFVKRARDRGMKIPIDPDAHVLAGLDVIRYGIGVARKGWLSAGDVLNTMETEALLDFFRRRRT